MKAARFFLGFFWIVLLVPATAFAQDAPGLQLNLRRDNGYGLGSQMQGHFSYRVSGPDNLERVEYLMDGEVIGESTSEPFIFRFITDDYGLGIHEMSAVGYTTDGQTLQSNVVRGDFVSPKVSNGFTIGIIVLVVVVIGARFLFFRQGSGKAKQGYGAFGGAICSYCGRPFARHWWAPHLLTARFDRCPHCGKWQKTAPASADQLAKAEAFEASLNDVPSHPDSAEGEQEKLRKQLDDSRFEDV